MVTQNYTQLNFQITSLKPSFEDEGFKGCMMAESLVQKSYLTFSKKALVFKNIHENQLKKGEKNGTRPSLISQNN